jgi:hypothetical protein
MDETSEALLRELDRVALKLHEAAGEVANTLEPVSLGLQQKSLMDNIKMYAIVSYIQDVVKEISRCANVVEPVLAERITTHMQQEDMEVVTHHGYSYAPDTKTYVSVSADNKPRVLEWLRRHEEGKELIKEDVHAKTFEAFIKRLGEENKPIPPEVKVFDKPTLNVRKLRKG